MFLLDCLIFISLYFYLLLSYFLSFYLLILSALMFNFWELFFVLWICFFNSILPLAFFHKCNVFSFFCLFVLVSFFMQMFFIWLVILDSLFILTMEAGERLDWRLTLLKDLSTGGLPCDVSWVWRCGTHVECEIFTMVFLVFFFFLTSFFLQRIVWLLREEWAFGCHSPGGHAGKDCGGWGEVSAVQYASILNFLVSSPLPPPTFHCVCCSFLPGFTTE